MRLARSLAATFNAPAVRYPPDPRALFVLTMCVFVGVPLIFANATPGSIAEQIDDDWVLIVWGVLLSAGSLVTLVGMARQSVNGILFEQVGSIAVGVACLIYATAIWFAVKWVGSVPMVIILGWGASCFWRWWQLQRLMISTEQIVSEIRDHDGR